MSRYDTVISYQKSVVNYKINMILLRHYLRVIALAGAACAYKRENLDFFSGKEVENHYDKLIPQFFIGLILGGNLRVIGPVQQTYQHGDKQAGDKTG